MSVTNYQAKLYLAVMRMAAQNAAQRRLKAQVMPILQRTQENRTKGQESRQRGLFA